MTKVERVPSTPVPMKVVIEIDDNTANALAAVLGICRGGSFTSDLYYELKRVVPQQSYRARVIDGTIVIDKVP